jgi:predicted  nucleic acid-binding Zn-ribbon protein
LQDIKRLKQKEENLAAKEMKLSQRESSFKKDLKDIIARAVASREKQTEQDTAMMIKKYEEMLNQLNRENRRLQASLKDVVAANRGLREHVT